MAAAVARQTLWWRALPPVAGPLQRRGIRLFRRRGPPAAAPAGFGAYDVIQAPSLPIGPAGVVPPSIPRPSYAADGVPPPEPSAPILATPDQIRRLRKAGQLVRSALDYAATLVRPGVTTAELDLRVHDYVVKRGAYPSPLNYNRFPKSICTSVNNVVCHGIPDARPLKDGDIINVDITVFLDGVHGDSSRTFLVGNVDEAGRLLVEATREALQRGIAVCGPSVPLSRIGDAISAYAASKGYRISPRFCGHGIGEYFHCPPAIIHTRNPFRQPMEPGMVFTIEPILHQGTVRTIEWDDKWTHVSEDGGRSAQFEHMVLITPTGHEVLT